MQQLMGGLTKMIEVAKADGARNSVHGEADAAMDVEDRGRRSSLEDGDTSATTRTRMREKTMAFPVPQHAEEMSEET